MNHVIPKWIGENKNHRHYKAINRGLSNHIPDAIPKPVGIVTDQPTRPIIPKPNQALSREARAFSLRAAFLPTISEKSSVELTMV
jgi:hypothetical protein